MVYSGCDSLYMALLGQRALVQSGIQGSEACGGRVDSNNSGVARGSDMTKEQEHKGILQKLVLAIEQGFEFLYSSCLCLKDIFMFFIRQCYQVAGTVIVPYPIKMMNNPTFGQGLIVSRFPYKDMFSNIPRSLVCPGVVGFHNKNISRFFGSPTFPHRMLIKSKSYLRPRLAGIFSSTGLTSFSVVCYELAAIYARVFISLHKCPGDMTPYFNPRLGCAHRAIEIGRVCNFKRLFTVSAIPYHNNQIISQVNIDCQLKGAN